MGSPKYVNGSWISCMCQVMFKYSKHLSNMSHVGIPIKTKQKLWNIAEMQFVFGSKPTTTTKNRTNVNQGKAWKEAW